MRYTGLALLTSAVVLSACGGGGDSPPQSDSTPATTAALDSVAAMPITGDTVVVNMVFNPPAAYSFEPMDVTIKAGDGIKFVTVSGQPHNVRLDPPPGTLPAALRAQLNANMTNKGGELMSPIIINPGEVYIISFAGVPAGTRIPIDCPLHIAQGMRGSVTIQ